MSRSLYSMVNDGIWSTGPHKVFCARCVARTILPASALAPVARTYGRPLHWAMTLITAEMDDNPTRRDS